MHSIHRALGLLGLVHRAKCVFSMAIEYCIRHLSFASVFTCLLSRTLLIFVDLTFIVFRDIIVIMA